MPANDYEQTFPFSVTSVTTAGPFAVGDYASVAVHVVSQYTGSTPTITFQVSNDGTNWANVSLTSSTTTSGSGASVAATTGTGMFVGSLWGNFFRLNFSGAYSSGTAAGSVAILPAGRSPIAQPVGATQTGAWGVGLAAQATGGYSFLNIPTAATQNAVKSGAGTLHNFTINTQVASATATLYDALTATGTKIATITLPASLVGDGPVTVPYDIAFSTGLTIVTVGTNFDCTVSYK